MAIKFSQFSLAKLSDNVKYTSDSRQLVFWTLYKKYYIIDEEIIILLYKSRNKKWYRLVKKYNSEEQVSFYNHYVQDYVLGNLGVQPYIHILDCTKISVNLSNTNYENSFVVTIGGEILRGYKLGVLSGVMDDSGVVEEIVFCTLKTHDMELYKEM